MGMRWFVILVVAVGLGGGGYYYWQQQNQQHLDIQTAVVKRGDVRRAVSTTGTVNALVAVDVGSQLSGKIDKINVDYSQKVTQNEILARIDPSTFEAAVHEQEASVAVATATVDLQQAAVQRADANLHKADLDLQRAQQLVAKGADSQATLDTAVAAQLSAAADLASAKAQVEDAKATLLQRQATLESARIDLDRTYIRSPFDGVVVDRAVQVGQTVAASLAAPKLFTIAEDLSKVEIDAQVDEADIGEITSDNKVSFTVDAYPDLKFDGQVKQIRLAPTTLQNVVTYTVAINADNPQGKLLPGMTANIEIVTGERPGVLTVPNESLRFQPRGAAEALVRDDTTGSTEFASASGDRSGHLLDKLKVDLDLTPEEVDKVRAGMQAEFAAIKSAGPPGMGPSQDEMREQARMRISNVLHTVLTPDQYQKFQSLQRARPTASHSVTVWTYEGGELVPHRLHVGLADNENTEITGGLKEGDNVVIRAREITP